jgi:wobble nucleotide-excising tRNase
MNRKFKNIASILFLLVFLIPSIVKLEHHHEHFECKAKNEKHYHILLEKCAVCNFEFSIFSSDFENIVLTKEQPVDKYCNNYRSANYSTLSKYSFLLRAPPYKQI